LLATQPVSESRACRIYWPPSQSWAHRARPDQAVHFAGASQTGARSALPIGS